MNLYNKIMLKFWLFTAIILVIFISYKSYAEGLNKWGFYYIFAGLAIIMYVMRRFMMNRMEKHLKYLEKQEKSSTQ